MYSGTTPGGELMKRCLCLLVGTTVAVCAGCGATDEESPIPRPFVMVEGAEVEHPVPLTRLHVTRRGEGLIVAQSSILSAPKLTCAELSLDSCSVETCTHGTGATEYGIASVEMTSGSNTYSAFDQSTSVEPADFWQPGAPIALRVSASESPSKPPFADAVLRGPPPLRLESPALAPSLNGAPGAKALELRVDRDFVVKWNAVAEATVFLSLTCTNESSNTTWWAQVRCEANSETGEIRVPRQLIDYLPGPHCNFTLAARDSATTSTPGLFFEFDVRRIAQNGAGIDADGWLVLR